MSTVQFGFSPAQAPFYVGVGIALLVALYYLLRRLERRRGARVHTFVETDLAPRLLVGYDARVRRPLFWLTLAGALLLLLALAQPHWGQAWIETARASRDVLVLLDTSESMNAQNPLPNRLERARQKLEALVRECPGDRFGLIVFSGDALLQCPLTLDHAYFLSVLRAVDTDTMTQEGTDIAEALSEAIAVFNEDAKESGHDESYGRATLVVSDGEQVSGDALDAAGELAENSVIFVMGIGDPDGAEVTYPAWMLQYQRVPNADKPHLSRLDEKTLSKVALASKNGVYVRSTPDNADVAHLVNEMNTLRAKAASGEVRLHLVNRYRWPLTAAAVCFAAEGLWIALMPHVRRWRMRRGAAAGLKEDKVYAKR